MFNINKKHWYYLYIALLIAICYIVLPSYYKHHVIESQPNLEYLKDEKLRTDLISEYERLQPLPGSVLVSSSSLIRSGRGMISYGFSTELSDANIFTYYDKQLKANGWIPQKDEVNEINKRLAVYAKGEYIAKIGCFEKKEKGGIRVLIYITNL